MRATTDEFFRLARICGSEAGSSGSDICDCLHFKEPSIAHETCTCLLVCDKVIVATIIDTAVIERYAGHLSEHVRGLERQIASPVQWVKGLETMSLRVRHQAASALRLARFNVLTMHETEKKAARKPARKAGARRR